MKTETKATRKAQYATPRLVVYGDIRQITQTMRMSGVDSNTSGDTRFS